MAFAHGSKARAYLQGFDVSGFVKDLSDDLKIEAAETTNLKSLGKEFIPGLFEATVGADGFMDGAAGSDATTFSFLVDSLMAVNNVLMTYYPQGEGVGNMAKGVQGQLTKNTIKTGVTGAGTVSLELNSDVGSEFASELHPQGAETVTGNDASSVDNGASSANGGVAYLQITAVSGSASPTLTATVQHSTDNSVFVDLVAFTAATAIGAQRVTVAGTVNRYTRTKRTISGTTPSFTYNVAFGRK